MVCAPATQSQKVVHIFVMSNGCVLGVTCNKPMRISAQLHWCHANSLFTWRGLQAKNRNASIARKLIVRKVKMRKQTIYGTSRIPSRLVEVKNAWEEVAVIVSSSSGITRMAVQC